MEGRENTSTEGVPEKGSSRMSDLCFICDVRQFRLSSETVNVRLGPLIRILVEIANKDHIGEFLQAKEQ